MDYILVRHFSLFPTQKPQVEISRSALSSLLVVAWASNSPLKGWKWSSTQTSEQISDSRSAVKSLISLCPRDGNPPWGKIMVFDREGGPTNIIGRHMLGMPAVLESKGITGGPFVQGKMKSTKVQTLGAIWLK